MQYPSCLNGNHAYIPQFDQYLIYLENNLLKTVAAMRSRMKPLHNSHISHVPNPPLPSPSPTRPLTFCTMNCSSDRISSYDQISYMQHRDYQTKVMYECFPDLRQKTDMKVCLCWYHIKTAFAAPVLIFSVITL